MERTPGAYIYEADTKEEPKEHLALTEDSESSQDEVEDNDQVVSGKGCSPARLGIGAFLIAVVTFVIVDSLTEGYMREGINGFLEWMEVHPREGVVLFMLVYCVATVMLIPASLLTLGSGFVFGCAFGLGLGTLIGTIAVFVGAAMGALLSFVLARYLLRDPVIRLSQKYAVFQALECALRDNGLKIFALLRLSPVAPFNVISYFGGVSALCAILPGTALYVFLGASAEQLAENAMTAMDDDTEASSTSNKKVTIAIIVIGALLGVGAISLTTRYARRELRRILDERDESSADDVDRPKSQTTAPNASALEESDDDRPSGEESV